MSKIIRTQKPSVLPYAMALVFVVLCAVLPVYKLWALLAALGHARVAFGVAQKLCPPRVVEREVPFHTGVEDAWTDADPISSRNWIPCTPSTRLCPTRSSLPP